MAETNLQILLKRRPVGAPVPEDFDIVETAMPEPGEVLEIGKGRIVREGASVAILSLGTRLQESVKAAYSVVRLPKLLAGSR